MRTMYDSTNPLAIPLNAEMVAGYVDGTSFRWPESAWNRWPNAVKIRIARRVTTNDGHVLDVESGIPTVWPPSRAIVDWVLMRRAAGVEPTIYCNQLNDWPTIQALFTNAGVREPQWWVARYNGVATIPSGAVAKQYANPDTHGQGHYDLSSVRDYWPGVDSQSGGTVDGLTTVEHDWLEQTVRVLGHAFDPTTGEDIGTRVRELDERLTRIESRLETIAAGNVDYAQLAAAVCDEMDRRNRDGRPETGNPS